ncbi:MAG: type II secretion system protein, partial [bacterium]|nr:type II secretion system protein [bacterium]
MNNNGFTLVELLITIAIIGILSSVTMVSLSSARDKAKDTS